MRLLFPTKSNHCTSDVEFDVGRLELNSSLSLKIPSQRVQRSSGNLRTHSNKALLSASSSMGVAVAPCRSKLITSPSSFSYSSDVALQIIIVLLLRFLKVGNLLVVDLVTRFKLLCKIHLWKLLFKIGHGHFRFVAAFAPNHANQVLVELALPVGDCETLKKP